MGRWQAYGPLLAIVTAMTAVPAALSRVPRRIGLFRFPYGTCNARAIAATVLARTRPGSIVIAHANGRGWNTAAALPLIVPRLRKQGYRFVTVSELLAAGEPVIAKTCYQLRPGDRPVFQTARRSRRAANRRPSVHAGAAVFDASD